MTLFKCTLANKFYYADVATVADTIEQASARFEAEAVSPDMLSCAKEERANWIEELGEYPGDDAYIYEAGPAEEADYISGITPEYLQEIEHDAAGKVWVIGSGGNG